MYIVGRSYHVEGARFSPLQHYRIEQAARSVDIILEQAIKRHLIYT